MRISDWSSDVCSSDLKTQDGDDWQSINASVHCNSPFNFGASSSGFAVGCGLERWRQARLHVREGFFGSSSLMSLPLSVRFLPSPTYASPWAGAVKRDDGPEGPRLPMMAVAVARKS